MNDLYAVYFLDGPKRGETVTIPEKVDSLRFCTPKKVDIPVHSDEWAKEAKIEYIIYHIHEIDGNLFGFCRENGLSFDNLVAKALVEYTSGLLDEATRQLQTINNMLDRDDQIIPDGKIHDDISEFLEKVRRHNE